MCGLFGAYFYGEGKAPNLKTLVEELGFGSTERGTDATGISYVDKKGNIIVSKKDVSAWDFKFDFPAGTKAVMGHTRRTTQGNAKRNFNNHPFKGKVGKFVKKGFAFAHNGVLDNDKELRLEHGIPTPKIETDSYIGVQLLEKANRLEMADMKWMAEQVEGMFAFTILENTGLWVIKNDSPFSLIHFKEQQLYVYASTDNILFKALSEYSPTMEGIIEGLKDSKNKDVEIIELEPGDIIKIDNQGVIHQGKFEPRERIFNFKNAWKYERACGYNYGWGGHYLPSNGTYTEDDELYLKHLIRDASFQGVSEEEVKNLLENYTYITVEDAIYDGTVWDLIDELEIVNANKDVIRLSQLAKDHGYSGLVGDVMEELVYFYGAEDVEKAVKNQTVMAFYREMALSKGKEVK